MKLSADLLAFSGRIGHQFRQPDLLVRAVTHASISSMTRPDNQRLEFLGDRVLGLAMAEALLRADAAASEGQLAPRYNALVRKETCADVAREIGLGDVLKLGRSEMMSGGRRKDYRAETAAQALEAQAQAAGIEPDAAEPIADETGFSVHAGDDECGTGERHGDERDRRDARDRIEELCDHQRAAGQRHHTEHAVAIRRQRKR